jgi:DNA mismatch repair protein MutL
LETGAAISVVCGNKTEVYPAPHHAGTTVEVMDLFCATPARLKFLRSDRTEQQYIENIIKKIAIAYPKVAFKFFRDGKLVLNYKSTDLIDSRSARVAEVLGKEFLNSCVMVDEFNADMRLHGYISLPTCTKSSYNEQYLYVNNRSVRDRLMLAYIKAAYQDVISADKSPITVLFLQIPTDMVDVNVHPTKAEVRFRDVYMIRNLVIGTLKKGLIDHGQRVDSSVSKSALDLMLEKREQTIGSHYEPWNKKMNVLDEQSYASPESFLLSRPFIQQPLHLSDSFEGTAFAGDKLVQDKLLADTPRFGYAKAQLHHCYIVAQTETSVVIVDQHAAHERICYEKLKQQMLANDIHVQTLFVPEVIELDDQDLMDRVLSLKEKLLGLVVEPHSNRSVQVTAIPQVLKGCDIRLLFDGLLHNLADLEDEANAELFVNKILATYSCYGSIRAGRAMTVDEMNALLREMERVQCTASCNHGRPTYVELSVKDLNNLFERT